MKTETRLNPDFSHRYFDLEHEVSPLALCDDIETMTNQAESVLNLISSQLIEGNTERLNDKIMFNAVESVIQMVGDIRATVRAYHEANRQAAGESA
jgi:hypothetical protein